MKRGIAKPFEEKSAGILMVLVLAALAAGILIGKFVLVSPAPQGNFSGEMKMEYQYNFDDKRNPIFSRKQAAAMHAAACFIVAHCVNPSRAIEINHSNKSTRPVLHNSRIVFWTLDLVFIPQQTRHRPLLLPIRCRRRNGDGQETL